MLHETNDDYTLLMDNSNDKGRPDLYAVKRIDTRDQNIEVDVLYGSSSYQTFILRIATPDFTPLRINWTEQMDFALTYYNGDGRPDLVVIKKSRMNGKCTEVRVLSGASTYQKWILRAEIPVFRSHGVCEFAVTDWTGDNKPDLIVFRKRDAMSNTTDVKVVSQEG